MKKWQERRKYLDRDKLTLMEYLETDFLDGFDYGMSASGWKMHDAERSARANGYAPKPKLADQFIVGLDSIPWGVFEQALAEAHEKAPNIIEPYLKTYLSIPRKSIRQACHEYKIGYQALRALRRDAIALIRGSLPIKARRVIAMIELEIQREQKLLSETKKALKKEAKSLFNSVLRED